MKNSKGITLISLGMYIVGLMIAISVLSMITTHYRGNLNRMYSQVTYSIEYDRLNMYLIGETEKLNNTFTIETDAEGRKSVKFEGSGNEYKIYKDPGTTTAVWLLTGGKAVKIADGLNGCSFSKRVESGKSILTADVGVGADRRIIEYVLRYK